MPAGSGFPGFPRRYWPGYVPGGRAWGRGPPAFSPSLRSVRCPWLGVAGGPSVREALGPGPAVTRVLPPADREFIEARRRALKRFINLVARHPPFSEDAILKLFLSFSGPVSTRRGLRRDPRWPALLVHWLPSVLSSHSPRSARLVLFPGAATGRAVSRRVGGVCSGLWAGGGRNRGLKLLRGTELRG